MNIVATAVLIGLVLASGVWCLLLASRAVGAPSFADRIAPQLRVIHLGSMTPAPVQPGAKLDRVSTQLLNQFIAWLTGLVAPVLSSGEGLQRRLIRAGSSHSVLDFRAQQVMCALGGALIGSVVGVGVVMQTGVSVVLVVLSAVLGVFMGAWLRGAALQSAVARREARMLAEFPAVAELMALSVGAGQSAVGALERVCRVAEGELADEFTQVLAQTRAGAGLAAALQDFSQRTDVVPLGRFVDGMVVAIERGTPLADVLRAQAQDVRDHDKRVLMEIAGKKEIAMLVPVVFFVLPLSVVFAVFPGLAVLKIGF